MRRTGDSRHRHRDLWVPLVTGLLVVIGGALPGGAVTHGKWSVLLIAVGIVAGVLFIYITAALIWGFPLPGGFEPPGSPPPHPVLRRWTELFFPSPEEMERRERRWDRQQDANAAEFARQQRTINGLYREYLDTHPDADPAMRAGTADLPKDWTEQRLEEMGEQLDRWQWRWDGRYRPDV